MCRMPHKESHMATNLAIDPDLLEGHFFQWCQIGNCGVEEADPFQLQFSQRSQVRDPRIIY